MFFDEKLNNPVIILELDVLFGFLRVIFESVWHNRSVWLVIFITLVVWCGEVVRGNGMTMYRDEYFGFLAILRAALLMFWKFQPNVRIVPISYNMRVPYLEYDDCQSVFNVPTRNIDHRSETSRFALIKIHHMLTGNRALSAFTRKTRRYLVSAGNRHVRVQFVETEDDTSDAMI